MTNTAFKKARRHMTTWVGSWRDKDNKLMPIYNQIDFIICKQNQKHTIKDAQPYSGTTLSSDHKLVKTTFRLSNVNTWKQIKQKPINVNVKRNRSQLSYDTDTANNYSAQLHELLLQNDQNSSTQKQWDFVKQAIETTVSKTIEEIPKQKQYRLWNKEVKDLSEKQKDVRIQSKTANRKKRSKNRRKKERNYVLHNIRRKNRETKEKHLDHLIQEIDNSKRDGGMFKAIKVLNRKQFTNPQVKDKDGKKVTSPTEIQNIITKHFKSKFRAECTEDIQPFSGQPRALNNPISEKEVRQSIKQLNNGRAPGEDNICNEYLKFAPGILDNQIAMIINKTFENHEDLDINNGILVALPKPGKPKGPPQNLRPVT